MVRNVTSPKAPFIKMLKGLLILSIIGTTILVAKASKTVSPVSIKGTPGAQALAQAYNAFLTHIEAEPAESKTEFGESKKTVGKDGTIIIESYSRVGAKYGTSSFGMQSSISESTLSLTRTGDIEMKTHSTSNGGGGGGGGRGSEGTNRISFRRGSGDTLIYKSEGKNRFNEPMNVTITVNADHTVTSSLSGESTLIALTNSSGIPSASQFLSNFIPDQPVGLALKPISIIARDTPNSQAIKCAYNNLFLEIQSLQPGTTEHKLSLGSMSKTATIICSIDKSGTKTVQTLEHLANDEFTTTQVLHPNGDIDIHFQSNGRLGSQTERYKRLPSNSLSYSLVFTSAKDRTSDRQIFVHSNGQSECIPEKKWGIPSILSGEAPGQKAAIICWGRVYPHGKGGSLSLKD